MKYCSECGESLAALWLIDDHRERLICPSCGTVHYQNPRVSVACAIVSHESLLLCLRANAPGQGKWQVPLGFLECGETLQAGAAREVFEETGVQLDSAQLELLAITDLPSINQIIVTFRAELTAEPALRANAESSKVAFVKLKSIALDELAWSEVLGEQPQVILDQLLTRRFGIHLCSLASADGGGFSWREYPMVSALLRSRSDS